jgi:hypothetical protein
MFDMFDESKYRHRISNATSEHEREYAGSEKMFEEVCENE